MKSQDLTLIAIIAIVVSVFSIVVFNYLLTSPAKLTADVEVVEPITADFQFPESRFFNDKSTNPTRLIRIGENENKNPFTNEQ